MVAYPNVTLLTCFLGPVAVVSVRDKCWCSSFCCCRCCRRWQTVRPSGDRQLERRNISGQCRVPGSHCGCGAPGTDWGLIRVMSNFPSIDRWGKQYERRHEEKEQEYCLRNSSFILYLFSEAQSQKKFSSLLISINLRSHLNFCPE